MEPQTGGESSSGYFSHTDSYVGTKSSLEQLVEQRIKQAGERKIVDKAVSVAKILGKYSAEEFTDGERFQTHSVFTYISDGLEILFRDPIQGVETEVSLDIFSSPKVLVFEYSNKRAVTDARGFSFPTVISKYIPGDWEQKLETAYENANQENVRRLAKDAKTRKEIHEKDLRDRFGL